MALGFKIGKKGGAPKHYIKYVITDTRDSRTWAIYDVKGRAETLISNGTFRNADYNINFINDDYVRLSYLETAGYYFEIYAKQPYHRDTPSAPLQASGRVEYWYYSSNIGVCTLYFDA